jgi:hypothetical protein
MDKVVLVEKVAYGRHDLAPKVEEGRESGERERDER